MTQTHQVSSTNSVFHCSEPLFMGHSNVPDIQMRLVKVPAPPWPRTQLHLGLSELAGILCMCSSPSYCSPRDLYTSRLVEFRPAQYDRKTRCQFGFLKWGKKSRGLGDKEQEGQLMMKMMW